MDTAISTQSCTGRQAQQPAGAIASPQSQALCTPNSIPQPTHMDARGATLTSVGRDQVNHYENPSFRITVNNSNQSPESVDGTWHRDDKILKRLPRANAMYNANQLCLEGTRTDLLAEIHNWFADRNANHSRVFWLSGLAGKGKSTIAATVAHHYYERGCLGSCFIFKRTEDSRSRPHMVFTTIAYQLAHFLPSYGVRLCDILKREPDVGHEPVANQFIKLLKEPLRDSIFATETPILIVMDAIDECDMTQDNLLTILLAGSIHLPASIRFFITSRPERNLSAALNAAGTIVAHHHIQDSNSESADHDIGLFLEAQFLGIRQEYPDELDEEWCCGCPLKKNWPCCAKQRMIEKSGGLFIWAATAIRFLRNRSVRNPRSQLDRLLGNSLDDKADFVELDNLYKQVLDAAYNSLVPGHLVERFRSVLGAITLLKVPLSISALGLFLEQPPGSLKSILRDLGAVIDIPIADSEVPQVIHPSFIDFVTSARCSDERVRVEPRVLHTHFALQCLSRMHKCLKRDICDIGDSTKMNDDIADLADRVKRYIPEDVQYACRFWVEHIIHGLDAEEADEDLYARVDGFLSECFLYWLEVLSLVGQTNSVFTSLDELDKWTRTQFPGKSGDGLSDLIQDATHFARNFIYPISGSALHCYVSALPFVPRKTRLYKLYGKTTGTISVVTGVENTWPPRLYVTEGFKDSFASKIELSPNGGKMVAFDFDAILCDACTGVPICCLPFQDVTRVAFSPDSQRLVIISQDQRDYDGGWENAKLILWDVNTLSSVCQVLLDDEGILSVTYLPDGLYIALTSSKGTCTRDPLTLALVSHIAHRGPWAISSFGEFLACRSRDEDPFQVLDIRTSRRIGQTDITRIRGELITVSPDGKYVAASDYSEPSAILLCDVSTGISRVLKCRTTDHRHLRFSPNGMTLVSQSDYRYNKDRPHLWNVITGSLVNSLNIHHDVEQLTFSPDSTRIAGVKDTKILIWDVSDGDPVGQPFSHADSVRSFVFAADWKLISLFGYERRHICKWDIYIHASLEPCEEPRITSATLFPEGTRIALKSANGAACWRDIRTGATAQFKGVVEEAAFSPDGTRFVSSSRDDVHPYRLWCACSGKLVGQPFGTGRWDDDLSSPSVSFSPDSKRIACGLGYVLNLCVVDAITGAVVCSLGVVSRDQFLFSPNSRYIALISEQQIRLLDAERGELIRYLPLLHSYSSVKFAPDSERVLLVEHFRCLVWNTITGHYHLHRSEPEEGDEEGDGDKGDCSGSERDGGNELEDKRGGEEEKEGNEQYWDDECDIWVVEWSPDGKIFRGDRLVDAELADLTGRPICSGTTFKIAFSHNAKFIVTLYADDWYEALTNHEGNQRVQIWDASTSAPIGESHAWYQALDTELIISWDSNRLISMDLATMTIFDMATGAQLGTYYDCIDLIPRISTYPNFGSGPGVLCIAADGWVSDAFSNSMLCWIPQRYRNMNRPWEPESVRVQYNGSVMVFRNDEWTDVLVIDLLDIAHAFNAQPTSNAPLVDHPDASALITPNRSDIIRPSTPRNPVHDDSPPICLTSAQLGGASHPLTSNHLAIENTRGRKRSISQVE